MTTFKRVTSKPFRMLALRLTFSIAGSYGILMTGTASSLLAQAPCDSCDGIPVRIAAPAPTRCTSCGHHTPSLADRLLGKLDHIGNSIERSIGNLPRAKCSSCSTKNGCDHEPTCGTEPACGVEASCGIDAAHIHSSNCGCANATSTMHGSPSLAKPFKSSTIPAPPPPQSAREGKPAHQRSPSELAPPLPTPTAPTPKTGNTIPSKTTLASRRLSIATNRVLRFARATTTIRERSIRKPSFRSKNATISRNRTNEKANLLRANQAVLSSAVSLIQRKAKKISSSRPAMFVGRMPPRVKPLSRKRPMTLLST